MRRYNFIVTGVSIIVLILGFIVYFLDSENTDVSYRLANVERGTIQKLVSASGGLNAVVTVEVGSGISGQISELLADFNTNVKAGQIIARIDPESFIARVQQVEAELSVAKALVATKKAAVVQ